MQHGRTFSRGNSSSAVSVFGPVRGESAASCRGRILFAPSGSGGFGYDPLFEIVEYHRSFGALSPLVKSYLSHRSRAGARIVPRLVELFDRAE